LSTQFSDFSELSLPKKHLSGQWLPWHPSKVHLNCCSWPIIICDRLADVGGYRTVTLPLLLFHRSKWIQLVVILTSTWWDVTCQPSNTHIVVQELKPYTKCHRVCMCELESLCICVSNRQSVCVSLTEPYGTFSPQGQRSTEQSKPASICSPPRHVLCVSACLCVCECLFPLKLSISKSGHGSVCVLACMWVFRFVFLHVCSSLQQQLPFSPQESFIKEVGCSRCLDCQNLRGTFTGTNTDCKVILKVKTHTEHSWLTFFTFFYELLHIFKLERFFTMFMF